MRSFVLLLAVLSLSIPACFAGPDKALLSAREAILLSSTTPQAALVKYTAASKKTDAAPVAAEYSYALAKAGLGEAALYNIDRALIAEPLNADIRFYLAEIFTSFGLEDASSELSAPVPAWLKTPLKLTTLTATAQTKDFEAAFTELNLLMAQRRYAQTAVQYNDLCKAFPAEARCHVGYALALERLGAYKTAAVEAKKNLDIYKGPDQRRVTEAFISDLSKRPPLKFTNKDKPTLKGRYLLFAGGGLSRADGRTLYSFNSRVGRFVSERLDISAEAGINGGNEVKDYNGLKLGAAARYNTPLPSVPLYLTLAAKVDRVPAPNKNFSFLLSPGLSYFTGDSSIDLFFDMAFAGAYKGSVTLSLGYTIYFGGGK